MHRLYPVTLHRPGFMKREGPARRRQRFHHQPVFVEGEAAAGRGWRDIAGMVNDLEHAWLAVDRQAIEAARRSGRAKRQRRRPAAPAAELHPDEPPSPWRLLIIGPVSREAGRRPSHRSEERRLGKRCVRTCSTWW